MMRRALVLLGSLFAASCSGGSGNTSTGNAPLDDAGAAPVDPSNPYAVTLPYIAFPSTFADFTSWTSYQFTSDSDIGGSNVHTSGPRTEYINHLPPPGATEFPLGTIIVKHIEAPAPNERIFAMVKRGEGFNSTGTVNWEFYELQAKGGGYVIAWQGYAPPPGTESYGGDPNASCNTCHMLAKANDYVQSPSIRLNKDGGS